MLLSKTATLKFRRNNKKIIKHYIDKGYDIENKIGKPFEVKVEDLTDGSNAKVLVSCDFCEKVFEKKWCKYLTSFKTGDCCYSCRSKKVNYLFNSLPKEEREEFLDRASRKRKETCLNKYGEISNSCLSSQKEMVKKTNLERYGYEHYLLSPEGIKKKRATNLEKYGFENPMKNDDVKKKVRNSLYRNGNCPTSKAQRHLCTLFKGKLNFPFGYYSLDIFFENLNIYIEYNGSGHNLNVKRGGITQKEFDSFQLKRYNFLKMSGLKLIRLDNLSDKLPPDEKLIKILKDGLKYLSNKNNYYIVFDLDKLA